MKPNFALVMSSESIKLVHRAFPTWHLVGDVNPGDPQISNKLIELRARAVSLEKTPMRCKLVLPQDHIRYLEVDAGDKGGDDLIQHVKDTLEGATPYKLNEIAYDWAVGGQTVFIATVPRKTLREAEKFAVQYNFDPVCFAGIPQTGQFVGEPFFGLTEHAASILEPDQNLDRETSAIRLNEPLSKRVTISAPKSEEATAANTDATLTPATEKGRDTDPAIDAEIDQVHDTSVNKGAAKAPAVVHTPEKPTAKSAASHEPKDQKAKIQPRKTSKPETSAAKPRKRVPASPITAPKKTGLSKNLNRYAFLSNSPRKVATIAGLVALLGALGWASVSYLSSADEEVAVAASTPTNAPSAEQTDQTDMVESEQATEQTAAASDSADPQITEQSPVEADDQLLSTPETAATEQAEATASTDPQVAEDTTPPTTAPSQQDDTAVAQSEAQAEEPSLVQATTEGALTADGITIYAGRPETTPPAHFIKGPPPAETSTEATIIPAVDGQNIIQATADGALTPEGIRVYAGQPKATPPAHFVKEAQVETNTEVQTDTTSPDTEVSLTNTSEGTAPEANTPETTTTQTENPLGSPDPIPATADGARTPEGVLVYAGKPQITPPAHFIKHTQDTETPETPPAPETLATGTETPTETETTATTPETPTTTPDTAEETGPRPKSRPQSVVDMIKEAEKAKEDAVNSQLASLRPQKRPKSLVPAPDEPAPQPEAKKVEPPPTPQPVKPTVPAQKSVVAQPQPQPQQPQVQKHPTDPKVPEQPAVAQPKPKPAIPMRKEAVRRSLKPKDKPRTIKRIVREARAAPATAPTTPQKSTKPAVRGDRNTRGASSGSSKVRVRSNETMRPSTRTPRHVAKRATEKNAMRFKKVNLIGTFGTKSNRHALVLLSNGQYVKVRVGDRLDGGRVSAIGNSELRYVRRGRNITLRMPKG